MSQGLFLSSFFLFFFTYRLYALNLSLRGKHMAVLQDQSALWDQWNPYRLIAAKEGMYKRQPLLSLTNGLVGNFGEECAKFDMPFVSNCTMGWQETGFLESFRLSIEWKQDLMPSICLWVTLYPWDCHLISKKGEGGKCLIQMMLVKLNKFTEYYRTWSTEGFQRWLIVFFLQV